jgi:hypothetical protein
VKAKVLFLLLLAWGTAPAMAQLDLITVYKLVRPILCAMIGQSSGCPLPENIALAVGEGRVLGAVARSREVFSVGTATGLPRRFFDAVESRALAERDFTVSWTGLKEDRDFLKRRLGNIKPKRATFTLNIVTVPETDFTREITRIPLVGIDDEVYVYVLGGWWQVEGWVVEQIYPVLRSGLRWMVQGANREAAIEAKEEALKRGGGGR